MQDIYIDDKGKGLPLVLIHGFLGSSRNVGIHKFNFFKDYYRVITPDHYRVLEEVIKHQSYKNSIDEIAKINFEMFRRKKY